MISNRRCGLASQEIKSGGYCYLFNDKERKKERIIHYHKYL